MCTSPRQRCTITDQWKVGVNASCVRVLFYKMSVHAALVRLGLLGEYDFSNEKLQDNTGVLPPKSAPGIVPENWEPPAR